MTTPAALRGLRQPDQRTCGPSALVAARMLVDHEFAPASFATEVRALHRELTAPVAFGRTQLPWPRALGTPPWAAARAMSAYTGRPYRTRIARLGSRGDDFEAVGAAVSEGHPCPLYVGSRWLPRHVILAVASSSSGVQVYNPAGGTVTEVTQAAFETSSLGRWPTPWFVVVPRRD